MLERANGILDSFNTVMLRSCLRAAVVCLVGMTAITLIQVGARYLFSSPFAWPEEVARMLMVWMTFLVIPGAYRDGLLIRLDSVTSRIPEKLQSKLDTLIHFGLLLLFVVLLFESVWLVQKGSVIRASSVNIPMGLVFSVMPFSFLLLIAVSLEQISAAVIRKEQVPPEGDAA